MALTKAQLEALKNSLLASQQPITAAAHRAFIQNVIDEMYDAQSRGNLLAGVQEDGTTAGGDTLLLIRDGQAFLVPTSLFGDSGTLDGLSDVLIVDEEQGDTLSYDVVAGVWRNATFDDKYIRKDINADKSGNLRFLSDAGNPVVRVTPNGSQFAFVFETLEIDGTTTFSITRQGEIRQNGRNGGSISAPIILSHFDVQYFRFQNNLTNSGETTRISAQFINRAVFERGLVSMQRSINENGVIRRDEQRLFYLATITTAGAINNQPLTAGIFNYRFTEATSISGFASGEIGMSIIIQNQTGAPLPLTNEGALSTAANRVKLIGGANLVIPIDGKATLIYVTGNRWELLDANFAGLSTNGFKAKFVRTQTGFFDPGISGTTPIGIFQTPFSWLASYFSVGTVIEIDLVGTFSQDLSNIFLNLRIGTDNYSDIMIIAATGVDDVFRSNYKITLSSSNEIKIAANINTPGGLSLTYFETATKIMSAAFDIDIRARFDNTNAVNNIKTSLIEVKVY